MEDERARALSPKEAGAALLVVLVAIVVLLPATLVLTSLAIRWHRQSLDYRDTVAEEFVARAGFEEARNRIASETLGLATGEATSFERRESELTARTRIARAQDIVLSLDGRILDASAAAKADLELTGTDPEGRVVYRFRKLEIYVVQVDVARRPTLPAVRSYGIVAKLPDGSVETLGLTVRRGFFDAASEVDPNTAGPYH